MKMLKTTYPTIFPLPFSTVSTISILQYTKICSSFWVSTFESLIQIRNILSKLWIIYFLKQRTESQHPCSSLIYVCLFDFLFFFSLWMSCFNNWELFSVWHLKDTMILKWIKNPIIGLIQNSNFKLCFNPRWCLTFRYHVIRRYILDTYIIFVIYS